MNNGKTPGKYQLSHPELWASAEAYLGRYRKRETLVCDLLLKVRADGKVLGRREGAGLSPS